MNETQKLQYMDFLSIAVEQLEAGNYEVAREFIDDVRVSLLNENYEDLSQDLQQSIDELDDKAYSKAETTTRDVYTELMNDG